MLNHKGTQTINTERLILRRFRESDTQDMYDNWASDDKVTKYLTWPPHQDLEVTKSILADWIKQYEEDDYYQWAIVPKDYGKVIGSISVVSLSNMHEHCEIGYCIGRDYWGKGITTEALKALISYLFMEVGFQRLQAFHHSENIASGKVMQKAGMKYEGILRNYHKNLKGEFVDCDFYAVIREDIM